MDAQNTFNQNRRAKKRPCRYCDGKRWIPGPGILADAPGESWLPCGRCNNLYMLRCKNPSVRTALPMLALPGESLQCPCCCGKGKLWPLWTSCWACNRTGKIEPLIPPPLELNKGQINELLELRSYGFTWSELEKYAQMWGIDPRSVAAIAAKFESAFTGQLAAGYGQ